MAALTPFSYSTIKRLVESHLESAPLRNVYDTILAEVEDPMLEAVMEHARYNQTKAAKILGINRGTLRKKLKRHGFIFN